MRTTSRVAAFIAAAAAAALVLSGCSSSGGGGGKADASSLTIGQMTKPTSLDPVDSVGSSIPYYQPVYDTLIKRAPDGTFEPMLATEWKWDDARTRLSLTLREDVKFDDGSALNADAVKANLERFRDSGGANATFLKDVTVEVKDPTHVDLVLTAPNPAMEFYLTDSAGFIANPATFAKADALKTTPDGTGPYKLDAKRTVVGTTWVYDRRENYWGDKLPYKEIVINAYDNENAIVNGLRTGQIDSAILQQVDQQIAAESDKKLKMQSSYFDYFGVVLFDRDGVKNPALKDVRVRQAINYGIDRKQMVDDIQQGHAEVTSQAWGKTTPGYEKDLDTYYDYDPAKAKKLLAEAGYANGVEIVLPKAAAVTSDAVASAMKASLAEAGITLTWQDVDAATALKQIFRDKEFIGLPLPMGQSSNPWVVASTFYVPGTFNIFGSHSDETTALLAKARTQSPEDATKTYEELNRYMVENAWLVPMYRLEYKLVSAPGVDVKIQDGMAVPSIYNYTPAK